MSPNFEQSNQAPAQSTPNTHTIVPRPMVHFADDIPSLPNENSEDIPRINTISLTSEENFISPTVMNIASTEQTEFASPPGLPQ